MVKGRKPLSNAVKEASGAFAKDPQRRNADEPKPKLGRPKIPEAVESDPAAKSRWHWVCDQLESMNLLAETDQGLIAGYCLDYSMMLSLWESIKGGQVSDMNAKGGITTKPEANQFHKFADRCLKREAELGLTPSARSRLRAPQSEKEDEFDIWLKRRTERRPV
jgi:P27 family predicted phage terminase small subunit